MIRRRISFFVHDLASNPIARAMPIAQALARDHDVELLGFLLSGDEVYAPYRGLLPTHALRCSIDTGAVLAAIPRLAALAGGDLIYACKPLLTTLGPALWASGLGARHPLLLDIEDDELVPQGRTWPSFLYRDLVKGWRHATAWKYTRLLAPAAHLARAVTVVGSELQRRYGGTVVLHGPDEALFDPARPDLDRAACRARLGLPSGAPLALFSGVPQPHKGWAVLLDALERPEAAPWHLVLAGPPGNPEFGAAHQRLGRRCHELGLLPYAALPELLSAVDAVPIPQLPVRFARSQVSAKALDAMAMARALIASRISDFPALLGDGEPEPRGWLVEPGDARALGAALADVAARPEERARRGASARRWFLANAGAGAIRDRLAPILEALA